ncbi:MAG TPA: hypothetical protein VMT03_17345 [Polyangia bacterium]|nr:hypothetical protein [Polyangia bacterium]
MRMNGGWIRSLVLALALAAAPARLAVADQAPQQPRHDLLSALLRLGLSHEAGWEARRLTVENGPEAITPEAAYRVGMALALDGRPDEAAPFLADAAAATDDPRRADQWQLAAGVVLLRARAFPHAVHLFARVEDFGVDAATRAFATRLRCVAEVLAGDGVAARACVAALPAGSAPPPAAVAELLDTLEINPHRRAIAGGVLSALLPGLGQSTAGRPGDGLLALGLNGGLAAATVLLIVDGSYGSATLVGLGLGLRYYLGNIQNGAAAWRADAERQKARAAERLVRLIVDGPR